MFANILNQFSAADYEEVKVPSFAMVLKSNPYRDANGKYTTKDKAFYQTEVALGKMQDLQTALSGMTKDDIDSYLKTEAGKKLIAEAATAIYKQGKHFTEIGFAPMSTDKLIEDYVPSKAAGQAVQEKLKSSLAAKKAWEKIYKDKAAKGVTEELPSMLDAIAAGNDKGGKMTAKMEQKLEFWKKGFLAGGGTQAEFEALVAKAHGKQASPPTSAVIDLAAKVAEPASVTGTNWVEPPTITEKKLLASKIAFELHTLKSKGTPEDSPEMLHAQAQWKKANDSVSLDDKQAAGIIFVKAKKQALLATTGIDSVETPTWKEANSLDDALLQNEKLGVAYYTSSLSNGKNDPKSVAIYNEWQKSKDYIKSADPSKDIPSLSGAQKSKAQQELDNAKAAAKKMAEQKSAKQTKVLDDLKAAAYSLEMNADDGASATLSENVYAKAKKDLEALGVPSDIVGKTIKAAKDAAKVSAASAAKFKEILKDSKATTKWYDDNDAEFKTVNNGNSKFDSHHDSQVGLLTEKEKTTLSSYTGSGYTTQNKTVAGTASEAAKDKSAEVLDKAMKKMTLGEHVRLRRNMAQRWFWESFGMKDFSNLSDEQVASVVGKTYTEKAFSSTSKNLSFNGVFSTEASKTGTLDLRIRAKKDIRGLDLKSLTHHSSESEVLLDKGVTYIVRKVERINNSGHYRYRAYVDAIGHLE